MARARFNVRTLVPWLGLAVLVLGGVILWLVMSGTPLSSREPSHELARRQVREQRGADWEVRYIEATAGPVVCGYAAPRSHNGAGHRPVAFISRLGRVLFADDPLPGEFRELQQTYCPGFAQASPPTQ